MGPDLENYSSSVFIHEGNSYKFPDCVENSLLQLLKVITWNGTNFDVGYLPPQSRPELKQIFIDINSQKINDRFINLVSNIESLNIYKNHENGVKYEISSNIDNFFAILNYLLNTNITEINESTDLTINPNIKSITLEGSLLKLELNSGENFLVSIKEGHSSHMTVTDILDYLPTYDYLNLIIFFTSVNPIYSLLNFNILHRIIHINYNNEEVFTKINIILKNQMKLA